MKLSYAQKQSFYRNGYVKIAGVVPQMMVDEAMKAINHSLGEGIDPAQITTFRAQSFCPELRDQPVITDLYNKTPARHLAESMIGEGKVNPIHSGQIALRFPTLLDPPSRPWPHLDGRPSPNNGVPEGALRDFTMLVGIALSDVSAPYSGNFTVWPGTHRQYEQYFKAHGLDILTNTRDLPPVDMPEPEQMITQAGDLILAHYQLAHTAAPNVSPHTRYAIYFRLRHIDHSQNSPGTFADIWQEWPGMQEVVTELAAEVT